MNTLLLTLVVLGDVGLQQAGATVGPVHDLNCGADAGLYCTRTTAAGRGDLACLQATSTQTGCVTPAAQTFGGVKTFASPVGFQAGLTASTLDAGRSKVGDCTLVDGGIDCPGPSQAAVRMSGPGGWLASTGDTNSNLVSHTPDSTAIVYDTTNSRWASYQGSAWTFLATGTVPAHFMTAWCKGTCSTDSNFLGPMMWVAGAGASTTVNTFNCSWGTAGSGGSTGVVVKLYDVTSSTDVCSCTLGACNTTAATEMHCTCGTVLANPTHVFVMKLKSTTDCSGNPSDIFCNVKATYTH